MADLTSAGTGAGGLGTRLARGSFLFVWACWSFQIVRLGLFQAAPLVWTLALLGAGAGTCLLTTPGVRPLSPARAVWVPVSALGLAAAAFLSADTVTHLSALSFAAYLVAFLIPRGNLVAGAIGSTLLIGAALAWAWPQGPTPGALLRLVAVPLGCVAAGVLWRFVLHRIVGRERAHRSSAARSAESSAASAEALEASPTELAAIKGLVVPVLERIAEGDVIDARMRSEVAVVEAAIRDRIRLPHLQDPGLVAEVERLRRLGVEVVLLGESSSADTPILPRLARACRSAIAPVTQGRVTIRAFPAHRAAALGVVMQTEDEVVRVQWSTNGDVIAAS